MIKVSTRRPPITAIGAALLALVVVDATRRVVSRQPRTEHLWPLLVLLAFTIYAVAVFAFFSTDRGRTKLGGVRTQNREAGNLLLPAVAVTPLIVSIASVFLGAPTWALWAAFAVTCVLLTWWAARARN